MFSVFSFGENKFNPNGSIGINICQNNTYSYNPIQKNSHNLGCHNFSSLKFLISSLRPKLYYSAPKPLGILGYSDVGYVSPNTLIHKASQNDNFPLPHSDVRLSQPTSVLISTKVLVKFQWVPHNQLYIQDSPSKHLM